MPPYQQQPQNSLQPPSNNPYEFIFSPQQAPKKRSFNPANNFGMLLGIILGGAVLLMIILAIVASMLGGSKTKVEDLVAVAQMQNELIRISDQGSSDAVQQSTRNLAVTAEYTMNSQQVQTTTYLAKNGREVDEKELALKQNARTDQQFSTAKTTSTFDLVYAQVMQNELTVYANNLKQLFTTSQSKEQKQMLSAYYEQTQMLISQIPYTQESISAGQ
jgi:hypothetical protein